MPIADSASLNVFVLPPDSPSRASSWLSNIYLTMLNSIGIT